MYPGFLFLPRGAVIALLCRDAALRYYTDTTQKVNAVNKKLRMMRKHFQNNVNNDEIFLKIFEKLIDEL